MEIPHDFKKYFHDLITRSHDSIALALAASLIIFPFATVYGQTSSQIWGCQRYGESMHCDQLHNDMEAYGVAGNSTLIHPLTTSETIYVDGMIGKAVQMHGEFRESIEMMNVPELNPKHFSVSFWLKPTTVEPYGHVISHSNKGQTAGWQFDTFSTSGEGGAPASTIRFGIFNSNGTLFSPADISLPSDSFTHIAGTFDGSTVKVYKNGELQGQRTFSGNFTAEPGVPLRIGSAAYCSSCNRWSGMIDDVRMYDRSLTADEVGQLDRMSDVQSGLIGYWKFDGTTDDTLGKNNGTSTTLLASMVFAPDGRLFFTEKNSGAIRVMTPDKKIIEEPFINVDDVYASWEQGLLGLALDLDFKTNHYVYVYYSALVGTDNGDGGKVINRILRFTDNNSVGTDMKVIMDNIPASRGYHSGGAMAFGPDGKLYITVGDATEHIFAQDPAIVIGKVLRMNKDGTIPADNPYPNSSVYNIGHRNMYGIAFDNKGTGLITENGDFRYDEINTIEKGGNYGFPTLQPPNLPPELVKNDSIKPLRTYWDTIAPTQMIYYTGDAVPELKGMFLFGSFTGDIYAIKLSDDEKSVVQELHIELGHFPFVPTIGIAQSPDGKIYYGAYQIYTLDSIGPREQAQFNVQIDAPSAVDVADVTVNEPQKRVVIDASVNGTISTDSMLTAKIPKSLLENVSTVGIEGQQGANIDFTADSSDPNFNTVKVRIASALANNSLKVAIAGTTVVPEFPAALLVVAAAFAATLVIKRKGLWNQT
jgi:glucose/arabinose dehydrogenase